jgi:hypothetical protein
VRPGEEGPVWDRVRRAGTMLAPWMALAMALAVALDSGKRW